VTFLDVYEMMIAFACKFGPPYLIHLFMRGSRDKREYKFKVTAFSDDVNDTRNGRNVHMSRRIPDITFGLSSYFHEFAPEAISEEEEAISKSFISERLSELTAGLSRYRLVLDPKWGDDSLLFPWAVYEAKKDQGTEEAALVQLKLAFTTYLGMLDQLVHRPGSLDQYQFPDSREFQIFGFTSHASVWRVYVGYLPSTSSNGTPLLDYDDDPLCDNDCVRLKSF
jgi:hypothetical protein